ncbi:uncharacterized protein PSANT_02237 [Moesziomyces antarcticus]|uniref:Uncharacterized protein n=1 Tax=Pseudozyma antarctica TaxID=84753 RepID=A0A5C3FJJ4_PSEA2|nr:uncharacterized protein PSANT_02237 [Moesziomyces antarcticus]
MATRSKQASEARADFWLRAEAEAEAKAVRYGRRAARGSRLQQQERWVHCCCASRGARRRPVLWVPKRPFQKALQKRHPKWQRQARAQLLALSCRKRVASQPATHRSAPFLAAPPRLASSQFRHVEAAKANFHRRWSSICVRLVQAAALHAGLSGDLPSLFRRSNKRNVPQFGVLATRHRKLLVIVKLPLRLPLASVAAGPSGRSRARIGGTL